MIHLKPEFFLMFFHYSIILKIYKEKKKINQNRVISIIFFFQIENI